MTLDEAKKIAEQIVGYADSGCNHCVTDLVERLNAVFPEFIWRTGKYIPPADENNWQGRIEVFVEARRE